MALTKRVEVLFDPREYGVLVQLARARGATIGAMVREAVARQYLQPSLEERREAVRGLLADRSDLTWEEAKRNLDTDVGRRL